MADRRKVLFLLMAMFQLFELEANLAGAYLQLLEKSQVYLITLILLINEVESQKAKSPHYKLKVSDYGKIEDSAFRRIVLRYVSCVLVSHV